MYGWVYMLWIYLLPMTVSIEHTREKHNYSHLRKCYDTDFYLRVNGKKKKKKEVILLFLLNKNMEWKKTSICFYLGYSLLSLSMLTLRRKTLPADLFSFSNTFPNMLRGSSAKLYRYFFLVLSYWMFIPSKYLSQSKKGSVYKFDKVLIQHTFTSRTKNCILWEAGVLTTTSVINISFYLLKYLSTS